MNRDDPSSVADSFAREGHKVHFRVLTLIGDGGFEEGDCAGGFLVREGHARSVIDADVDELPAEPFAARPSAALTPNDRL
jgi:hypothetical protein